MVNSVLEAVGLMDSILGAQQDLVISNGKKENVGDQKKTINSLPPIVPVYQRQVLIGDGLARGPPCLPHSQVLMGAGLAGRPPSIPETLLGAGL